MSPMSALVLAVALSAQPSSQALISDDGERVVAAEDPVIPVAPIAPPPESDPPARVPVVPARRADVPRAEPDLAPYQHRTTRADVDAARASCLPCANGTALVVLLVVAASTAVILSAAHFVGAGG
ncbi:MAG: hypothetical protein JST54_23935 [Deltaproteobacteria bacterium]|nr:hypothetical protein [Deltaproteobacteria bacterium]